MAELNDETFFRRRLSLAGQLMVLIGVLALGPLVVTNYYGYERSRAVIEKISAESLQNAARVAATETASFVEERQRLVSSLVAGNTVLADAALEVADSIDNAPEHTPQPTELERHLKAKAVGAGEPVTFSVITTDGVLLGSSDGAPAGSKRRADGVCVAIAEASRASGLSHGESAMLHVAEEIPARRGRSPGIFCAHYEFSVYDDLRALAVSQSPVRQFQVIDPSGRVLAEAADAPGQGPQLDGAVRDHVEPGESWTGSYTESDGKMIFASLAPVPSTDWFIAAEVPASEAMVVLDDLKKQVFWMGSGFVLVVILGMLLMVRRTIGPLRDLLAATRDMSRGQLAQKVDTRGPREVAELAKVFNSMSRHVADLHDTLEERVDQRTDELRQNQAFSELLFNSMEENLAVVDSSCRVVKVNQAALRTYGEDIVGKSYYEAFEGENQPGESCPLSKALDTGAPVDCERVYNVDGNPEIMSLQLFPLPPSQGQGSDRVLMVSRKITDEKQEQANQVHGGKVSAYALMAATVAHEIGNPLSSISAHLQLAARKEDPEYTEKVLGIVSEQVERINRLLRDITEFSVRQSSRETMVSWNQVAEDAVRLLRHDPRGRFAEFDLDLAEHLPSVKANPDHCLQVLLNLGLNGLDAMDGRGTLRIATGIEDGCVVVRVTDQGPGVPEEMRQKIFEPYFSTKSANDGTGLGLFISRRILEQSGGGLEYEDAPDAGATFVISTAACGAHATSASAQG